MDRLLSALAWAALCASACFVFVPRDARSAWTERVVAHVLQDRPSAVDGEYELAEDADVRLDGEPCKYADVPRDAQVVRLGVKGKTIVIIHFRSRPKP